MFTGNGNVDKERLDTDQKSGASLHWYFCLSRGFSHFHLDETLSMISLSYGTFICIVQAVLFDLSPTALTHKLSTVPETS
jgi:hypothetical protein